MNYEKIMLMRIFHANAPSLEADEWVPISKIRSGLSEFAILGANPLFLLQISNVERFKHHANTSILFSCSNTEDIP